jgi:cysteine synthase A
MIEAAARQDLIDAGTHIIEATSGDMGVALASVCAGRGHRLTITMPQSSSPHRQAILRALGAAVVPTPDADGMPGAIARACELVCSHGNAWMPRQFDNPVGVDVHEATTGPEIWDDADGKVDMIATGVGTGGTITGVTRFMRTKNPAFESYAVEPASSAVLSGGAAGCHRIPGLGAGFVPEILDTDLLTGVETVTEDEAGHWTRRLAAEEGLFVGISGGASVCGAARLAERPENRGKTIVTVLPCTGERNL